MLHTTDKIIKHKVGLLNLAEELGNVSKACQVMGLSQGTFYRYKSAVEEGGIEALFEQSRRKPNLKNRVDQKTELAVVNHAIAYPAHGQHRASNELRQEGIFVSGSGVRSIWVRHQLENFKQRLKALLLSRDSFKTVCRFLKICGKGFPARSRGVSNLKLSVPVFNNLLIFLFRRLAISDGFGSAKCAFISPSKDTSIICLIRGVNIPSLPVNDSPDFRRSIASVSNSLLNIACFVVLFENPTSSQGQPLTISHLLNKIRVYMATEIFREYYD